MIDIQFTINNTDLLKMKKYCSTNDIIIISCDKKNNYTICNLHCELYQYSKLKKQIWRI